MRRALVLLGLTFCLLAPAADATLAPGDLDFTFGSRGFAPGDTYRTLGGSSMAVGPNGETFVLEPRVDPGCTDFRICPVDLTVVKFNRDGSRDPAFGEHSVLKIFQVPYWKSSIAVSPEGEPVIAAVSESPVLEVAGKVSPGGKRSVVVTQFRADGMPDISFGSWGMSWSPLENVAGTTPALAVLPDGKVVVAAELSPELDPGGLALIRYTSAGVPDPTFGQGGRLVVKFGTQARPANLVSREGGPVGGFEIGLSECCKGEGGTAGAVTVARFLPDGALDGSLAGSGSARLERPTPSYLQAIAPAGAGKLYAVVEEERRGSVLVRLRANGSLDPSFGRNGEVALLKRLGVSGVVAVAPDSQGGIVGVAGRGAGVDVFRLRASGAPDRTFAAGNPVPIRTGESVNAVTTGFGFQPDGKIVVLGEWGVETKTFRLARLIGGTSEARCLGKRATIVGTRGVDEITGTQGRDVIAALGGADEVRALGGKDLICGGKGKDRLLGGPGEDEVRQ
jgi:uncharacterized delta-60 repeat protein